MTSALATHSVAKRYRDTSVLSDVSLEARAGEVTGLLGPNGAGKTSLLAIIAGLRRATSGSVSLWGRTRTRSALADVGILLDHPGLWPFMTGRQNLVVHAKLRRTEEERIDAVLGQVGLAEDAGREVKKYSLGMRWRLGIAIALLAEPSIVILDEPTNGLDPVGMRDMRRLLRSLADSGRAVLVSSHQLYEVSQICDRVAILASGQMRYQGPLEDLAADDGLETAFFRLVEAGSPSGATP